MDSYQLRDHAPYPVDQAHSRFARHVAGGCKTATPETTYKPRQTIYRNTLLSSPLGAGSQLYQYFNNSAPARIAMRDRRRGFDSGYINRRTTSLLNKNIAIPYRFHRSKWRLPRTAKRPCKPSRSSASARCLSASHGPRSTRTTDGGTCVDTPSADSIPGEVPLRWEVSGARGGEAPRSGRASSSGGSAAWRDGQGKRASPPPCTTRADVGVAAAASGAHPAHENVNKTMLGLRSLASKDL